MNRTQLAKAHVIRVPFVSACPGCGHEQAQWYTHSALLRLLHRGYPVEGYCTLCDEYWRISSHEREALTAKLGG